MKNTIKITLIIASLGVLSSCGVGYSYVLNQNHNATQVELSESNFKVVDKVSGSSEVEYVFFFGGIKKRNLYKDAYTQLLDQADMIGKSKAITNLTTEEHVGGFPPFYTRRTITVHAQVIEFE